MNDKTVAKNIWYS